MKTRLTSEILLTHGFVELKEKDSHERIIYSLNNKSHSFQDYPFDIHITLNPQFPDSNPNSGIVSIFMKEETTQVIPEDLWDKEEWTEEDQKRADENTVVFESQTQPIAWHVTTYERLNSIVKSLTLLPLKYHKK